MEVIFILSSECFFSICLIILFHFFQALGCKCCQKISSYLDVGDLRTWCVSVCFCGLNGEAGKNHPNHHICLWLVGCELSQDEFPGVFSSLVCFYLFFFFL